MRMARLGTAGVAVVGSLALGQDGKDVAFAKAPFSWSDALRYDPELKLVLLNNSSAGKVWALKFDRQSAGLEEMK